MYLRTKIVVSGVIAACVLTLGVGLLPRAEGQSTGGPEVLKIKIPTPPDSKWEYMYVPMKDVSSKAAFEKLLGSLESERWELSGNVEFTEGKQFVFKRLRTDPAPRLEAAKQLRELEEREKQLLHAKAQAEYARMIQQALEAEAKAKALENENKALEKAKADALRQRDQIIEAERKALEAEKKAREEAIRLQLQQDDKNLSADEKEILKKIAELQEELEKRKKAKEKVLDINKQSLKTFPIKHVKATELATMLNKLFNKGDGIVAEERTNSIIVRANAQQMATIEALIAVFDKAPAPGPR